ncbi:hypothetical protein HALDL1_11030 [Halobacterium sp. DL1]|jgi:hypothetical protein|nr:hypothetical protein HALDL1_11030 [Halobacterium sp. DL1]
MTVRNRLPHLRERGPLTYYCTLLTLVSLVAFPVVELSLQIFGVVPGFTFYDFIQAFYTAGERAVGSQPLYARVHNPYVYPPVVVSVFVPFTVLPPHLAGTLWVAFSLVLMFGGVTFLLRSLDVSLTRSERVLVFLALFGFFPTILWVKSGQVSGLLAGAFCVAAGFTERARVGDEVPAVLSGGITAVTSLVKPMYAPANAHLLRDWRRLLGGIGGVVFLYGTSVLVFGVDTFQSYVDVLLIGKGWGQETVDGGVSSGITEWGPYFFRPFYVLGDAALYAHFLVAGVVATGALVSATRRSEQLDRHVLCLGFLTVPLATPIPDLYAVYMILPALIVVLVDEFRRPDGVPVLPVLAVFSLHVHSYVLGFFAGFGVEIFPQLAALRPILSLLQLGIWGLFALFGLQVYRAYEAWTASASGRYT